MIKENLIKDFFTRDIRFDGIKRELEVNLSERKIISLVGPRRAGKTWYFYYLFQKVPLPMYINFEDIAFRNLSPEEFFEVIKIFSEIKYPPKTLLLDEVQNLKDWSVLIRSLHDREFKIFITGSSSKLLPKEISTQLRGRTLSYILLPFSFREFLKAKKNNLRPEVFEERGVLLKYLKEYLTYGGFPEVVLSQSKERILKEYLEEIFYKDFVERHEIRSLEFGKFLFEFCFQNFSKEISFKKVKNFFGKKISDTTLYSYVEKLQDTLAIFFVERFEKSLYLRRSFPRKVYVVDIGPSTILRFEEDFSRRMENVVFLELLRETNINPLIEIYYWKDSSQYEVDFVIKEGIKVKKLIQVTYANSFEEVKPREIRALLKAKEVLKCENLIVITWDYEDEKECSWFGKKGKIKFIPLWKFLLE